MEKRDAELTDEVWARLDAGAGRLSRRETLLLVLIGAVALVLVAAAGIAMRVAASGLRLTGVTMTGTGAGAPGKLRWQYTYTLEIGNSGATVRIDRMGHSLPGLDLVAARPMAVTEDDSVTGYHAQPWPVTLEHGNSLRVELVYQGDACHAGTEGADVPATLHRIWGSQQTHVDLTRYQDWAALGCTEPYS